MYIQCLPRLSVYWRKGTNQAFQGLLDNGFNDTNSRKPKGPAWPQTEKERMEVKWSVESWPRPLSLWAPDTILWLFPHFWSKQLEQTSSATGSIHMLREQGAVCFSAGGKLSGEGRTMWFQRPRSALSLPERTQSI